MKRYWYDASTDISVYCGNCIDVMSHLPNGAFSACITDPPYGQLGYKWDTVPNWDVFWQQIWRLLTDNASCAIWGSAKSLYWDAIPAAERVGFRYRFEWITKKLIGRLWSYKRPIRLHEFIAVLRKGKETEIYSDMRQFGKQPESVIDVLCYQAY